jgi:hypothetical protein
MNGRKYWKFGQSDPSRQLLPFRGHDDPFRFSICRVVLSAIRLPAAASTRSIRRAAQVRLTDKAGRPISGFSGMGDLNSRPSEANLAYAFKRTKSE